MLHKLLIWSLFGPGLVKGILLCPDNDWNLFGSKCYKITDDDVSYDEGQAKCMNKNLNATLIMPKTIQEAQFVNSMNASFQLWLGLRFYMGSLWMWDDYTEYEASGSISWSNGRPLSPPHLCVCIFDDGHMCDWGCMETSGVVCQRDLEFCPKDSAWIQGYTLCYIMLIHRDYGVTYNEAKERCGNINGTVIMPKTEADARWIAMSMSFGSSCWIGLADYDADYIYTWEDGINEPSSELYWNGGSNQQPNGRDNAYLCTVMRNGEMYDVDCNTNNRVICQVNATTELPTTFYRQTTNHADLETTTLPATNTSLTLTSTLLATNTSFTLTTLECEELWMHQRKCNCQEPSAIPEIPNDIITYRLDKTTLSSYIRKRNSASDPRKSSFYIGCVGITVLVLSVLFIVVLDFLPRG